MGAVTLVQRLSERAWSVAFAESCTGGGIAGELTEVPGASAVFELAVVSYSNAMKQRVLGVPEAVLVEHGAVSGACVEAMLRGLRSLSGADLCAAVSGIAGPGGGDEHKPVGTVWIAVSRHEQHWVTRVVFPGDRRGVRRAAGAKVFEGLNRLVEGQNPW